MSRIEEAKYSLSYLLYSVQKMGASTIHDEEKQKGKRLPPNLSPEAGSPLDQVYI